MGACILSSSRRTPVERYLDGDVGMRSGTEVFTTATIPNPRGSRDRAARTPSDHGISSGGTTIAIAPSARADEFPLTDEQHAIVEHGDGPLVVIAGAGTGKTRVIVERVRWLLERNPTSSRSSSSS